MDPIIYVVAACRSLASLRFDQWRQRDHTDVAVIKGPIDIDTGAKPLQPGSNEGLELPSECREPTGAIEECSWLSRWSERARGVARLPDQPQEFFSCGKGAQEHLPGFIHLAPEVIIHVEARCLVPIENGPDSGSIDFFHS